MGCSCTDRIAGRARLSATPEGNARLSSPITTSRTPLVGQDRSIEIARLSASNSWKIRSDPLNSTCASVGSASVMIQSSGRLRSAIGTVKLRRTVSGL